MRILIILFALSLTACNWAKEKAKNTVNKTGEVVAKTGSEFVDGVKKGVEKTFESKVTLSDKLLKEGLNTGKILIASSDSSTDNILSVYCIFNENINRNVLVKLFTENNLEYGRVSQTLKGKKGEAKYVDFVFGKRVNIDSKSNVIIE